MVLAKPKASNSVFSLIAGPAVVETSLPAAGFGMTTTGGLGGEAVEREGRRLRVAVVADKAFELDEFPTVPLAISAAGLLLEATLADFAWRLRGAMASEDVLGLVRLGHCRLAWWVPECCREFKRTWRAMTRQGIAGEQSVGGCTSGALLGDRKKAMAGEGESRQASR